MQEKNFKNIARILIVFTLIIFVYGIINSLLMIGRPFGGFLLTGEAFVHQITFWYWGGYALNLQYLDHILQIDGITINNSLDFYENLDRIGAGSTANYLVRRAGGQLENISIEVARFTVFDYLLTYGIFFVIAAVFLLSSVSTFFKRPSIKLSFVFLILCSIFVCWLSTVFAGRELIPFLSWVKNLFAWTSQLFLGASFFHFGLVFLEDNKFFSQREKIQILPYILAMAAFVVLLFSFFPAENISWMIQSIKFSLYFLIAGFIFLLGSFIFIRFAGSDALTRQRARLYLLGITAGTVCGILAVAFVIMKIKISVTIVLVPTLVMPLVYSYAILRYNPFEVDGIIRKIITTTAIIGVVILAYMFFVRFSETINIEI